MYSDRNWISRGLGMGQVMEGRQGGITKGL